jgi:membrane protein required for beta-lactamase induction
LNGDFQQTYQAAERAYGGGDYETAHHLASGLLKQLDVEERADDDQVHDAVLGWRAFVALLLGHIELHGRERPDQAANYYQLALDCQPQDTLADLARQGLQRSLVEPEAVQAESLPSMLQDPFLTNTPPCIYVWPKPIHGHAMAHESHLPSTSQGNTSA